MEGRLPCLIREGVEEGSDPERPGLDSNPLVGLGLCSLKSGPRISLDPADWECNS